MDQKHANTSENGSYLGGDFTLPGAGIEATYPDIAGKIAVITGAGQGIGRGMAVALALSGATVILVGRTESKLRSVAEEIVTKGGKAHPIALDIVSDDSAPEKLIRQVQEEHGGVDILINNANVAFPVPLLDSPDTFFRQAFETGPRVTLSLMRLCQPIMAARGGGVMINLASSAAVRWDTAGFGVYGAIKEAIRCLTRAAANEWGKDGIRVLNVAPHGYSPGLEWWIESNPEEAEEFVASIPLGRIGDPVVDIGRAVVFLCSSDARYLTGATIPLDGGQSRWG